MEKIKSEVMEMKKYWSITEASENTGISRYSLRLLCNKGKIRFNKAGSSKFLLRPDWLEEDLYSIALRNQYTQLKMTESLKQHKNDNKKRGAAKWIFRK